MIGPTYKVLCVVSPPRSIEVTGSSGSASNTTQRTRWTKPRAIIWGLNRVYNPAGSSRETLERGESFLVQRNVGIGFQKRRGDLGFDRLTPAGLGLEDTRLLLRHARKAKRRRFEGPIPSSDSLLRSHDESYGVTLLVRSEATGGNSSIGIIRPRLQAGHCLASSPVNSQ